ncbi:DUF4062 domain-containing protein [uncultured Bradyrhizobium sp.]|uniref:DUF4062 domain-containing protein n=1 Tax=uncultured Bradyrhizobium sp. TaxID=199684 RepID=UPI0035CB3F36
MKVFISSLISGFESLRAACKAAVATLRHEPVMAESFGARSHSAQVACLQGLRESDLMLLVLGERYGPAQASGLSATHEEYRDAKGRKPVIAFVQTGVTPEPEQAAFIDEVQSWEGGLFRGSFATSDDLRDGVIRALHDYAITNMAGPVDPKALVETALALLPRLERNVSRAPMLNLALAGGPFQALLRPAEIEASELADVLHQAALFGDTRIFDRRDGVDTGLDHAALILSQNNSNRIQLDEQGRILLRLALNDTDHDRRNGMGFPALIEEKVLARLMAGLAYASWLLDHIDQTQRLTHLAIAARIDASDYMAWRTQGEQDASPNSGTMGWGNENHPPIHVCKPRAAVRLDRKRLAEDILVPLRRQWKQR